MFTATLHTRLDPVGCGDRPGGEVLGLLVFFGVGVGCWYASDMGFRSDYVIF